MRASSIALQRWLLAWIGFILVWSMTFLVYWVNHEATLVAIAEFFLPLLILPLITSAYGEVNTEGKRMLKVRKHSKMATCLHISINSWHSLNQLLSVLLLYKLFAQMKKNYLILPSNRSPPSLNSYSP